MAAWRDSTVPSGPHWLRVAAACFYFGALLGFLALVAYRVLAPIVNLP